MKKAIICRGEAEKQLELFKDACGYEDPKEIATGGKQTTFPVEVMERVIASIMLGRSEVTPDGKNLAYTLKVPVKDLTVVTIAPRMIKQHERRQVMEGVFEEYEMGVKMLSLCSTLTAFEISEMVNADADTLMSIAGLTSFM